MNEPKIINMKNFFLEKNLSIKLFTNCSTYFDKTVSLTIINKTRQKLKADWTICLSFDWRTSINVYTSSSTIVPAKFSLNSRHKRLIASNVADDIDGECGLIRPAIKKWKNPVKESKNSIKYFFINLKIKIKWLNQ